MKKTTKKTNQSKRGLSNPAVVATLASTTAGQKAIKDTTVSISKAVKITVIATVVVGVAVVGYKMYKARFVKMLQNTNYPKPNISESEARLKADNVYNALYGAGANFNQVKAQLQGLNYNGFVLVYNAFGRRESATQKANPSNWLNIFRIGIKGMTLTEWLLDQFGSSKLNELRLLLPGNFI